MSQEQNVATFRRLLAEGFSDGNVGVVDELCSPDFEEHQNGVQPPTREGLKAMIAGLRRSFPDLTVEVVDVIAQDDKISARARGHGTDTGGVMGRSPTGRAICIDIIDICRFEGGKIVEHWGVADRLGMLEQLGYIQRPRQAAQRG